LLGVLKKWLVEGGFFVVSLWWIGGDLWCVDGRIFEAKNTPLFRDLFLGGCG
jgi:hypothetical protein